MSIFHFMGDDDVGVACCELTHTHEEVHVIRVCVYALQEPLPYQREGIFRLMQTTGHGHYVPVL
jgi:hypothetical protein